MRFAFPRYEGTNGNERDVTEELQQAHRALCSPFIDEDLYRMALGGTRGDIGTVARYLRLPVGQRPNLSVYFDRVYYAACHSDLQRNGDDPLLHFILTGFGELRSPHPLIDLPFILSMDPHALGDPRGLDVLHDLLEFDLTSSSPYFDLAYYHSQHRTQSGQPGRASLRHFLTSGIGEGLRPNGWLDPAWYAVSRPDVPKDRYGALRHFIVLGDLEAHAPGPEFDGAMYRLRYPDVAESGIPPLFHYLMHGRYEGRQAVAERFVAAHVRPAQTGGPAEVAPGTAVPFAPEGVRLADAQMRARLAHMWQARKDSVSVSPPFLVPTGDPREKIAALALPRPLAPRVSILIPVYNEADVTAECLTALAECGTPVDFEVVVADDCSTDPDVALLAGVEHLVYVRHSTNLGFIRACNAAFAQCRAPYVLLLNNDTQVMPGAIERMVAVLDDNPDIGAVGPKLIYPNGRLQEAGCFIRANGESGMVGLFGDPAEGGYCFDRDVAYCSGAALMVRRDLVGEALFDEAYLPAYCEDADLCLRLIASGYRIRYAHDAVVVHHLSVSTNRQSATRKLRRITRNQQTLCERWSHLLPALDRVRTLAFYLPQFHPTPENDLWWGAGFTEWTNVAKARPSYAGQYQPHLPADLGFYDLRLRETLARQAALAARYGIEGFCVYYYNFGSRRVLAEPIDLVRRDPSLAFHWCLCWANENWTKHWDGGEREILLEQSYDAATLVSIVSDVVAQAADPRYLRVNGRPIFLVYRPLMLPDAAGFAASCRRAFAAAGFPGVHLVYVESMEAVDANLRPEAIGFDAAVEFPPQGRAVPAEHTADVIKEGWSGYRYDYPQTVAAFLKRDSVPYKRYPTVFPSWDNTPRQPLRGTSFDDTTPEAFRVYTEAKIDEARQFLLGEERLLFVNAWNEWAEGAHLEPDTGYGHRWLEALRDAVSAKALS
jgi:GT2 family glycosyltransferase